MIEPTYLGEIPLDEETLAHFGIKGMKWGRRKAKKGSLKGRVRDKYTSKKTSRAAFRQRQGQYHKSNAVSDDKFDIYARRSGRSTQLGPGNSARNEQRNSNYARTEAERAAMDAAAVNSIYSNNNAIPYEARVNTRTNEVKLFSKKKKK